MQKANPLQQIEQNQPKGLSAQETSALSTDSHISAQSAAGQLFTKFCVAFKVHTSKYADLSLRIS